MRLATIAVVCVAVLCVLAERLPASTKHPDKVYRIGYVLGVGGQPGSRGKAFLQGMRELGYTEGQNLVVEWGSKKGKRRRLSPAERRKMTLEIVTELVRRDVDCIITRGSGQTRAAQRATSTIPIVMTNVSNSIGSGFIDSFARPGGNITGIDTLSFKLAGKRLELIKEAFPKVSQVNVVMDPNHRNSPSHVREIGRAARALGLPHEFVEVRTSDDLENAFRVADSEPQKVFMVVTARLMHRNRARIIDLAAKNKVPVMYTDQRYVAAGGLMGYGPDRNDLSRYAATFVDKILKGAKPADLPVEQPRKFELLINLKTAKRIGITIPSSVLYRADKVIK